MKINKFNVITCSGHCTIKIGNLLKEEVIMVIIEHTKEVCDVIT